MKKLNKLLIKSFSGPLVATFFIALFILILQFLWQHIDDMAGKGFEANVIAELLLYASAGLVPTALPLAILLSSLMTFGNLGENLELTAIKSSGISLQRFMRPLITISALFSICVLFYSNHVIPYTNLKAMSLIYDIKKQRQELSIREGVFYNAIEGYSIKVSEKDPKTKLMKDIMIYDHSGSNKANAQVTTADSGYIRMTNDETKLLITLFDGQTYQEMDEKRSRRSKDEPKYPHQITKFDKQTLLIDLKGFDFTRTDESLFSDNYQMLNLNQLEQNRDSLQQKFEKSVMNFSNDVAKNLYVKKPIIKRAQFEYQRKKDKEKKVQKKIQNNNLGKDSILKPKSDTTQIPQLKDSIRNQKMQIALNDTLNDSITKDTAGLTTKVKNIKKDKQLNIMAAYDSLEAGKQIDAINRALTYARGNVKKISNSKRTFERTKTLIYKHQIEWHKKFTLSFACIIFFFIGAPLGSIIRKGGLGTPLVISVVLFIIYYIISMTGENFAEKGVMPAYIGMWISSFIFLPIGMFLTYKAANDSVILETNTYIKSIKKILSLRIRSSNKDKDKQKVDT